MGLKSGSQGSGLDDDDSDDSDDVDDGLSESSGVEDRTTEQRSEAVTADTTSSQEPEADAGDDTDNESYPYKLRRKTVNDDREQVPFFLRDHVLDGEQDLKNELEKRLGETVYKSDYREAAMVIAQENPEQVAEKLREWGYDL